MFDFVRKLFLKIINRLVKKLLGSFCTSIWLLRVLWAIFTAPCQTSSEAKLFTAFDCPFAAYYVSLWFSSDNNTSKIAENLYFGPKSSVRTNLAKNGARSVVRTNLQDFRSAGWQSGQNSVRPLSGSCLQPNNQGSCFKSGVIEYLLGTQITRSRKR